MSVLSSLWSISMIYLLSSVVLAKYHTNYGGYIVTPDKGFNPNQDKTSETVIPAPVISSTDSPTTIPPTSATTTISGVITAVNPVTDDSDTINIEAASTEETSTKNIDLSNPNKGDDFRKTSTTTEISSIEMKYGSISQQKCNEYYKIGNRETRSAIKVFLVGGTSTRQKEFPHMAALGYGTKASRNFLCGGSLISENYVITAAHCLTVKNIGDIQYVRLGTTLLHTETLNSMDYNVVKRIPHPNYEEGHYYNDIALLQLDQSVSFNEFIAPICLYCGDASNELVSVTLTAIGWGRTAPNGDVSAELQKIEINYVPHDTCQLIYSNISKDILPYGIREDSQICAGTEDGSKDACQGDSGGPLQLQKDGKIYLVGITSFGIGCGRPGSAGVYTKVSNYIPWIESVVWGK